MESSLPPDSVEGHDQGVPYAKACRAGDLVFTAGLLDLASPPAVALHDTRMKHQTRSVYDELTRLLASYGAGLNDVLSFVQYFRHREQVNDYIEQRRTYYSVQPTSTGIIATGFSAPHSVVQIEAVAAASDAKSRVVTVVESAHPKFGHLAAYGFSHALGFGDWIFCSGAMAMDGTTSSPFEGGLGSGLASRARWDPNMWTGKQVKLEVATILEDSLGPLLDACGASLNEMVYADVHLLHPEEDCAAFVETWMERFAGDPPLTSITPASGLGAVGGRIEITPIALRRGSALTVREIDVTTADSPFGPLPYARRVGDFVFMSTQVALGDDGRSLHRLRSYPDASAFYDPLEIEMNIILDQIETICGTVGGDLSNLVKARVSLRNMQGLPAVLRPWRTRAGPNAVASFVEHRSADWLDACDLSAVAIAYIPEQDGTI